MRLEKYLLVYILTNPADISFILFFEAEKGIIFVLFRGLKPLPYVLSYFVAFGIFRRHYDLKKLISKKYLQKYLKVSNPALLPRTQLKGIPPWNPQEPLSRGLQSFQKLTSRWKMVYPGEKWQKISQTHVKGTLPNWQSWKTLSVQAQKHTKSGVFGKNR